MNGGKVRGLRNLVTPAIRKALLGCREASTNQVQSQLQSRGGSFGKARGYLSLLNLHYHTTIFRDIKTATLCYKLDQRRKSRGLLEG